MLPVNNRQKDQVKITDEKQIADQKSSWDQ